MSGACLLRTQQRVKLVRSTPLVRHAPCEARSPARHLSYRLKGLADRACYRQSARTPAALCTACAGCAGARAARCALGPPGPAVHPERAALGRCTPAGGMHASELPRPGLVHRGCGGWALRGHRAAARAAAPSRTHGRAGARAPTTPLRQARRGRPGRARGRALSRRPCSRSLKDTRARRRPRTYPLCITQPYPNPRGGPGAP